MKRTAGDGSQRKVSGNPPPPLISSLWCDTKSHCLVFSAGYLKTWYVPTNPYTGMLATRCVVGVKPRGQCTEPGLNGDGRTHRRILLR